MSQGQEGSGDLLCVPAAAGFGQPFSERQKAEEEEEEESNQRNELPPVLLRTWSKIAVRIWLERSKITGILACLLLIK